MTRKLHDPDFYNLMSDDELVQEDFDVISAGVDGEISADEANLRHEVIVAFQIQRKHRNAIIREQVQLNYWSDQSNSKLKALRKVLAERGTEAGE